MFPFKSNPGKIVEMTVKIFKKMYISSLKRLLLLVLQLSFPKNVPHFRAILRPPETAPPAVQGQQGLSLRHWQYRL